MDEREEEKIFLHQLQQFWESKGNANIKIPQIGGRELEVYRLYKAVTKRGGSQHVSNNKQWKEIVNEFGLPPTCTSASFTLRNHYQRLLLSYEQKYFFGKDDGQIYVDPDLPQGRKKLKTNFEDEQNDHNRYEQDQYYNQHEYTENQLSQLLTQQYAKFDKNEQISYIKKTKIMPNQSELKRVMLAFESRTDEELTFALNHLLLYSCNLQQSFLLDQAPQLLDNITSFIEDCLRNIPSLNYIHKIKLNPIVLTSQQLEQIGINSKKNCSIETPIFSTLNVLENYNHPVSNMMNPESQSPLDVLRKQSVVDLIQGTYEKKGEIKLLEKLRITFTILRNLSLIRPNEQPILRNERLKCIITQIYIYGIDNELQKYSLEIFSVLSRQIHLKNMLYMDEFLRHTFELLNNEPYEEIELSVEIMRNLISIQDNEYILENYLNEYLDYLAKLLIYQNQEVRESVLEFFCHLSDLKMSTRLTIAKHPKIILRIIALLASGPSKPPNERNLSDKISEKNIKLAAITLNNISQAPASKPLLSQFEKEIFIVACSDETVTPLLAPILYDLNISE